MHPATRTIVTTGTRLNRRLTDTAKTERTPEKTEPLLNHAVRITRYPDAMRAQQQAAVVKTAACVDEQSEVAVA